MAETGRHRFKTCNTHDVHLTYSELITWVTIKISHVNWEVDSRGASQTKLNLVMVCFSFEQIQQKDQLETAYR